MPGSVQNTLQLQEASERGLCCILPAALTMRTSPAKRKCVAIASSAAISGICVRRDCGCKARPPCRRMDRRSIRWRWQTPIRLVSCTGCRNVRIGHCSRASGGPRAFAVIVAGECRCDLQQTQQQSIIGNRLRGSRAEQHARWPLRSAPADRARVQSTFDQMGESIAAFEASPEVSPFSSKFDAFLAGNAELTAAERRGYDLFNGQAKCTNCHVDDGKRRVHRQHDGESRRAAQSGSVPTTRRRNRMSLATSPIRQAKPRSISASATFCAAPRTGTRRGRLWRRSSMAVSVCPHCAMSTNGRDRIL